MKRIAAMFFLFPALALIPAPASAGSSQDAALALSAFAVFNQIVRGETVLHDLFGTRQIVIVHEPPAVIYVPPPAVVYAPPPVVYAPAPPPVVVYPHYGAQPKYYKHYNQPNPYYNQSNPYYNQSNHYKHYKQHKHDKHDKHDKHSKRFKKHDDDD